MQAGGECDHPLEDTPDAWPGQGREGGGVCGHDGPPGHPADLQHHVLCSSHTYQVSLTKFRMKSTNS